MLGIGSWIYVPLVLAFLYQVAGLNASTPTCSNGGTCTNLTANGCNVCSCVIGFEGPTCEELQTKVLGVVTYNTSLATGEISLNTAAFANALKEAYPAYQHSVISSHNLTDNSGCIVNYVMHMKKPKPWATFDLTAFRTNADNSLRRQTVTDAVFSPALGLSVTSATSDIDECASSLHDCDANANCYDLTPGYACKCNDRFVGNGTVCTEISCWLSRAPKWPSRARRTVFLQNETKLPNEYHSDKMPYKTYIEYTCPEQYDLVSEATQEKQATVIECVGPTETTHEDSGWTGSDVDCVIKLEFTVALIMAVVSSVVIILVGGAFIVSCTKKKIPIDDTVALEMNNSFT